jgi:hypothetical protein
MSEAERIRVYLKQILGIKDAYTDIIPCTVKSVTGNTCDVTPIDGSPNVLGVRLSSESDNTNFLPIPSVGSVVIVGMIDNEMGVVIMFGKLDSIKIHGDQYGGLTKTQELKTQLDKTNQVLQAVVNSLTGWTPVANDGGASLKAYASTQLAGKTIGDYSNIENTSVKHG